MPTKCDQILKNLDADLASIAALDEGEVLKKDARRSHIINAAVRMADTVLLDYSDGTVEELDYLTAKVAEYFTGIVIDRVRHRLLVKDLEE